MGQSVNVLHFYADYFLRITNIVFLLKNIYKIKKKKKKNTHTHTHTNKKKDVAI